MVHAMVWVTEPVGPGRTKEYLYKDEFESYVKEGVLTMHTAFSREQEFGRELKSGLVVFFSL